MATEALMAPDVLQESESRKDEESRQIFSSNAAIISSPTSISSSFPSPPSTVLQDATQALNFSESITTHPGIEPASSRTRGRLSSFENKITRGKGFEGGSE